MHSKLSFDKTPSTRDLDNIGAIGAATLPRHRWYFVKEAFSPDVVARAVEDSSVDLNDIVLDPFAGSGTVPLCCSAAKLQAIGVEVNPFLAAVARAKLLRTRPQTLLRHTPTVYRGAVKGWPSPLESFSTFSADGGASKWLFNRKVLRAFEGGWRATIGIYPPVRDLLRLALIGAAMDVCNAFKDGKCLRYLRDWPVLDFDDVSFAQALEKRVQRIVEDLEGAPLKKTITKIITADARYNMATRMGSRRFKLCVTSPPYLNSFDYTDVYRPELFLGKFVKCMAEMRMLRLRTLRSHTQVKWEDPKEEEFGPHFGPVLKEIEDQQESLWNPRIPKMIRAYFEDMRLILRQMRRLAGEEASVWIVVSTSAYAGVEIPVDLIVADIACREGWYLREISVMRYLRRVPGQQWKRLEDRSPRRSPHLRESIVILDEKPVARRVSGV